MKRRFSLIPVGCILIQLTFGSSSGYMKVGTKPEEPTEVSGEVQVQDVEPQPEVAEEQEQPVQNISEEEMQTQDQKDEGPQTTPMEQNSSKGKEEPVRKQISDGTTASPFTGRRLSEHQSFRLALEHGDEGETRTTILEATQGASAAPVAFENLPEGTYSPQVVAKGHRAYKQIFQMDGYDQSIQLYLDTVPQLLEDVQPGLLAYTALNVRIKDFIDVLDRGSMDNIYSINQDGTVDLAGLQRLHSKRREYKQQTSTIERRVPRNAVDASVGVGTQLVSEKLEDVLTAGSAVTSKHADGQTINTDRPLHLTFDLQQNENPIHMGGFTIQTPFGSANKIVDGMALVEIEGQDGPLQVPAIGYCRSRRAVSSPYVKMNARRNPIVHFGNQTVVKRVIIRVIKTTQAWGSLVEISRVEFLNGMETRVPEPGMNIPKSLQGTTGGKKLTVS